MAGWHSGFFRLLIFYVNVCLSCLILDWEVSS